LLRAISDFLNPIPENNNTLSRPCTFLTFLVKSRRQAIQLRYENAKTQRHYGAKNNNAPKIMAALRRGESSVPADNSGHVETNKRAPEDAGGICAKR
jgi:hypothetical protein